MFHPIVDHIETRTPVKQMGHEVFNPKSSNYLDFDHFIEDAKSPKGLVTYTKITHGFRRTSKNLIYMPNELKKALPSLTSPYPIPIKPVHRNATSMDVEPIGRATEGSWIALGVRKPTFNVTDAMDLGPSSPKALRAVLEALESGILYDNDFEGLGYVQVKGLVTDKSAIEKILNGQLLTVSVEMSTDSWWDPQTGELFDTDKYSPGEIIDGKPRIAVAGALQYEAYAYTTHPADKHAQTFKHELIADSLDQFRDKTIYFDLGSSMKIKDSVEDADRPMTLEEARASYAGALNSSNMLSTLATRSILDTIVTSLVNNSTIDIKESINILNSSNSCPSIFKLCNMPLIDLRVIDTVEDLVIKSENINLIEGLESIKRALVTRDRSSQGLVNQIENTGLVGLVGLVKGLVDNISSEDNTEQNTITLGEPTMDTTPESATTDPILNNIEVPALTLESVMKFLEDNVDSLEKIKETYSLVSGDKLKSLESIMEASALKHETIVGVYKGQVQDSMTELLITKGALDSSIEDHRETLVKLNTLVNSISLTELVDSTLTIKALRESVYKLVDSVDQEKLDRLHTLGKEPDSEKEVKIEDASIVVETKEKAKSKFTKTELMIADRWNELKVAGKKTDAAKYLSSVRRTNIVPNSFNPQLVVDSLANN